MKNIIVSLTLILSLSLTASAQTTRTKLTEDQKKELKTKMDAFKAELKLTPEQQPKFEEINLQFVEDLAKLKQDNGSKFSKYRKLKAASSERNKKIKDLLTAEQYKIFKNHQKDMKDELKSLRSQ
ncbi:hypothetical protein [Mucilaginibacter sp. HD30]